MHRAPSPTAPSPRTPLHAAARFSPQSYHDFLIAQGLLPPELLEKAVMQGYVKTAPALGSG